MTGNETGDQSGSSAAATRPESELAADIDSSTSVPEQDEGSTTDDADNSALTKLEAELGELRDQYLRKQADFENFRKRMTREREDAVSYANSQLLLDITGVIDDFERAIKSADEAKDYQSLANGVALIEKQLISMLDRKWGLKRFDSEGEVFDPQKHQAVATEERPDDGDQLVLEDYQKGYMLHDRVLRPARVKVSTPSQS